MSTNRNTDVIGHSFIFPPEVIDDIHIKSELGRYRMRGFSIFKKMAKTIDSLSNSKDAYTQILSLPIYPSISKKQQDIVISNIKKYEG